MDPQQLNWCEPPDLANSLGDGPMALYYSSAQASYSGGMSLLAHGLVESVDIESFSALDDLKEGERFAPAWFGYFGYEMKHDSERYTKSDKRSTTLPRGRLMRFSHVYVFDHANKKLTLWSEKQARLPAIKKLPELTPPAVKNLSSNMTRAEYEKKVAMIVEEIREGNLYQANLTRKFFGTWDNAPSGLALFGRLCKQSPAPYSAYLRMKDGEILSSSPELFLKIGADGSVSTRPIKGTAPRGKNDIEDAKQKRALEESAKNRAENLMITDLMRNDLARSCVAGSVKAHDLFEVTPHAAIFHMASTVSGTRAPNKSMGELLRGSFPPGSMTGAPKIRAVQLCNELEGVERGVYSGAIGWLGGDGSAEFSVVIRTLILQNSGFEFQVGGGVVADSSPEGEWQETVDKSLGIIRTLGISRGKIEAL